MIALWKSSSPSERVVGETLKRSISRDEKDAEVLNGLAWECAINDIFLTDALKAAEKAVELEPQNANIIDTLAEVHFRMGHVDKAIETESRAVALAPNRQDLMDSLKRYKSKKHP